MKQIRIASVWLIQREISRVYIPNGKISGFTGSYWHGPNVSFKIESQNINQLGFRKNGAVDTQQQMKFSDVSRNKSKISGNNKEICFRTSFPEISNRSSNLPGNIDQTDLQIVNKHSRNHLSSIDKKSIAMDSVTTKVTQVAAETPKAKNGVCLTSIDDKLVKSSLVEPVDKSKASEITEIRQMQENNSVCDTKSQNIVIHVVDPNTGQKKDFIMHQKLLMSRMKFFEKYTTHYMNSKAYKKQEIKLNNKYSLLNELDITVQCQIEVFKWLLRYIGNKEKPPLEPSNVTSILVSADSLIMRDLVDECLIYIKNNIAAIVEDSDSNNTYTPTFKSHLAKQLSKMISIDHLDSVGDKK